MVKQMNKKKRRHSGRYTPLSTISHKQLKENDIFLEEYYNEWSNYRDGMRDFYRDFKLIKENQRVIQWWFGDKRGKMNEKQKKHLKRRIAMKVGRSVFI